MEAINICLFLYKDELRARGILENLNKVLRDRDLKVYVYIDNYNKELDQLIYSLASKYNFVTEIRVREKRYGLKKQVIAAMRDCIVRNENYTLFVEDDLILSSHAIDWLEWGIKEKKGRILCLYSEFKTLTNKRLKRFSSWGYCLNKEVLCDFVNFISTNATFIDYIKLITTGIDVLFQLYADKKGKISSWAVHFVRYQNKNSLRSLHPPSSLVLYKGIDNIGTHTKSNYKWAHKKDFESFVFSNNIEKNFTIDLLYFFTMLEHSIKRKLYDFIRRYFHKK